MAVRPPSDAVAALRSLGRRSRGLFLGLGDDESPDDLAHRPGADGRAALDHLVAATRDITLLGRGLQQTLIEDEPALHPAVGDPAQRVWEDHPGGTVDERLAELTWEAEGLAERVGSVSAPEWGRTARVAGQDASIGALAILWDAVDSALAHLADADRTLREVRGRP